MPQPLSVYINIYCPGTSPPPIQHKAQSHTDIQFPFTVSPLSRGFCSHFPTVEYRHKGLNPGDLQASVLDLAQLYETGSPSPHFFCQQGLSWEPRVFFSRRADLLPQAAVTSPSRNRTDHPIGLSVKRKGSMPDPSSFVLYQGGSLPMLGYFWIALSSSGVIIRDSLIAFSH